LKQIIDFNLIFLSSRVPGALFKLFRIPREEQRDKEIKKQIKEVVGVTDYATLLFETDEYPLCPLSVISTVSVRLIEN
jgi:hypothetical protein